MSDLYQLRIHGLPEELKKKIKEKSRSQGFRSPQELVKIFLIAYARDNIEFGFKQPDLVMRQEENKNG